uniref:Uncharacterized protein LOC104242971 n=1 Tax=Nicotiana sylvestris TaxID=4096 RepID=A0A1U7Y354_NICSY|nr:PREDICTED: uncharacterized protein LOC104242971 [Nicotiana sylvestris]
MHKQYIIGQVTEFQNGNKFNFGAIYGMHTVQDRKILWEDMEKIIAGINGPCVLMGDYNTILSSEDRMQGTPVQEFEVKYFKEFIWEAGLTELRILERKYTWTNNHVHSKIDRILVNATWIQKWPNGNRPFKFFNCLTQHKEFEDTVYKCWTKRDGGTIMNNVWMKLKILKTKLKQMNSQDFNSTGQRIQVARAKLEGIQEQMVGPGNNTKSVAQEKETNMELVKWLEIEESIMKQKSRIKWLNLGDSNTLYFYACVKNRQATNHIGRLTNSAGQLLMNANDVETEILKFYKQLLGTTTTQIPAVNKEVMRQGYNLSRQQQMKLIKVVTEDEIKTTLQGISDNKAP